MQGLPRRRLHRPPRCRRHAVALGCEPRVVAHEDAPPLAIRDVAERQPQALCIPTATRPMPFQVSSQRWSRRSSGARGSIWRKPRAARRLARRRSVVFKDSRWAGRMNPEE